MLHVNVNLEMKGHRNSHIDHTYTPISITSVEIEDGVALTQEYILEYVRETPTCVHSEISTRMP